MALVADPIEYTRSGRPKSAIVGVSECDPVGGVSSVATWRRSPRIALVDLFPSRAPKMIKPRSRDRG